MAVRLTVKQRSAAGGAEKGTEVLLDEDIITLGRDKTCQVVLSQMAVSRSHARITRDGTLFFVEDLGSAYGTTINGKALPKGEKRLLRNGDTIAIAQFDVTFDRVADASQAKHDKTSFLARHVVKDVMRGLGSGEGPYFRVMNGPREGQRIEIQDAQELVFGREEGVDVVLADDLVSRRHAKVRRDWSGTHIEDLGSRNGIKVNRKRAARKTLKDRDEVEIGGVRLLYLDPSEVREAPLVLAEEKVEEEGEGTVPPGADEPHGDENPSGEAEAEGGELSAGEEPGPSEPEAAAAPEEEPAPEPEPAMSEDEFPAEESPAEDEEPDELPHHLRPPFEDEGAAQAGGNVALMRDVRKLVPVAVMGVFALLALALLIALLAGA